MKNMNSVAYRRVLTSSIKGLLGLGLLLLPLSTQSQTADSSLVILEHADRWEGNQINETLQTVLIGHVKIRHQGAELTGDRALYLRARKRVILTGQVQVVHQGRTLKADTLIYLEESRQGIAQGRVHFLAPQDSVALSCERALYDRNREQVWASKKPRLVRWDGSAQENLIMTSQEMTYLFQEKKALAKGEVMLIVPLDSLTITCGRVTYDRQAKQIGFAKEVCLVKRGAATDQDLTVESDTMTYYPDEKKLIAGRGVRLHQGKIRGRGEKAIFFEQPARQLTLTGQPLLADPHSELSAEEITLHFQDDQISEAVASGMATGIYRSSSPAGSTRVEESTLTGQTLTMVFQDGVVAQIVATGNAIGEYFRPQGPDQQEGKTTLSGQQITALFGSGRLNRILATGDIQGEYEFSQTRASQPALPERPENLRGAHRP